jgi:hypothetical protein
MIDDPDFAPLKGENIFMQVAREQAFRELGHRRGELANAIALTRAVRPDHPNLAKADATLAEFDRELQGWLASWTPDNGFRGYGDLAGH